MRESDYPAVLPLAALGGASAYYVVSYRRGWELGTAGPDFVYEQERGAAVNKFLKLARGGDDVRKKKMFWTGWKQAGRQVRPGGKRKTDNVLLFSVL